MKKIFTLILILAAFVVKAQIPKYIHTNGRYIFGPCGDTLLLRGVNYAPYNWGFTTSSLEFDEIAKSGANAVRIVWYKNNPQAGTNAIYQNYAYLDSAISKCIQNKMIAIIEIHDYSCSTDTTGLLNLNTWWTQTSVLNILKKYKESVIVNYANEALKYKWASNPTAALATYKNTYQNIITALRNVGGFNFPIMIDAPDCGSNSDAYITSNLAKDLIQYDPLHNLIFSAHAYWYAFANNDSTQMAAKINVVLTQNIPLVLGEIGDLQDGTVNCEYVVNYKSLLKICQQKKLSWIAWSWDNDVCSARQVSSTGNFSNLTTYGNDIVNNSIYGLLTVNAHKSQFFLCKILNVSLSANATTICKGANTQLSASPTCCGVSPYTFSWSSYPTGFSSTLANPTVSPTINTTYFVTVTDASSATASGSLIIKVNALPTITAGGGIICSGNSQNITAGGAITYSWSNGLGSGSTKIVKPTITTTYTVTGTDVNNCKNIATAIVTVTLLTPAKPAVIIGNTYVCQGSVQTYSVAPVTNATSYNWSVPTDATIKSGQGTNILNLTWGHTSYTLSVTAANCNGATVATTKAITIPLPSKPAVILGNAAICAGTTQTYSVAPVINSVVGSTTTYIWSVPSNASNVSGLGTNMIDLTWGNTSYTLSVTAANCNGKTSATTKAVAISKCTANEITISVNDINESNLNIEVYPNPNNGQFTLSMTNNKINNENVKLQVLNMIGQVVYTEIISSQDSGSSQKKDFQLSDLSAGTYFLQVLTTKELFNKKIILVK